MIGQTIPHDAGGQCPACGSRFFQKAEFCQYVAFGPGGGIAADAGHQVRLCLCGFPKPPRPTGRPNATDTSLNESLQLAWAYRARLEYAQIWDDLERQFVLAPELRALEERLGGLEKIMQQMPAQNSDRDQESGGSGECLSGGRS